VREELQLVFFAISAAAVVSSTSTTAEEVFSKRPRFDARSDAPSNSGISNPPPEPTLSWDRFLGGVDVMPNRQVKWVDSEDSDNVMSCMKFIRGGSGKWGDKRGRIRTCCQQFQH